MTLMKHGSAMLTAWNQLNGKSRFLIIDEAVALIEVQRPFSRLHFVWFAITPNNQ
jgi:hypothetical protein